MATQNIINPITGQTGYQVPGASLPQGWQAMGGSVMPAPTPTIAPKVEAPAGNVYQQFSAPTNDSQYNSALDLGIQQSQQAAQPFNEQDIRSQTLARMQQEIDAVNSIYGEQLRQAQIQGQSRLGSSAALAGRSGSLGSNVYQAQNEQVVQGNTAIENSIRQEQMAKIAAIQNKGNADATAEIAAKRKAQQEGLDSYIKYLGEKTTRKATGLQKVAQALLTQKLDISQIDPAQLKGIADSYGVSVDELKASYATEKKAYDAAQTKLLLDQRKELAAIGLTEAQTLNIERKYQQDERQIGMNYAQKNRDLAIKEAELAIKQKESSASSGNKNPMDSINLVKGAINRAFALADASGNTGIIGKTGRLLGGADDYTNLIAETNTIRTNVLTMMTDPSIKKFFGPQMSNADVQLMTSAGTTLNPELQSPANMKLELGRLQDLILRAENAVRNGMAAEGSSGGQSVQAPDGNTYVFTD